MSQTIPSVLYVEDDLLSREIMILVFRRVLENPHLTIFENSARFMERLTLLPRPPQLILLDIYIEPHSGFEVLRMIRTHPDFAHTPVAAVTASSSPSELKRMMQAGFDGVILKPVFAGTLPEQLDRLMNGGKVWPALT
ncbi:MAG: response regulator [Anaerolineae bacterium]